MWHSPLPFSRTASPHSKQSSTMCPRTHAPVNAIAITSVMHPAFRRRGLKNSPTTHAPSSHPRAVVTIISQIQRHAFHESLGNIRGVIPPGSIVSIGQFRWCRLRLNHRLMAIVPVTQKFIAGGTQRFVAPTTAGGQGFAGQTNCRATGVDVNALIRESGKVKIVVAGRPIDSARLDCKTPSNQSALPAAREHGQSPTLNS
jgi:hypothetical protein